MKRFLIIVILFFPVLTLLVWCYFGYWQPRPKRFHAPPTNSVMLAPTNSTTR